MNVPNPIPAGSKFTIIDNDGSDAITGTFQGVAEGGFVSAGGQSFTVSYVGGDGNDVVLTRSKLGPHRHQLHGEQRRRAAFANHHHHRANFANPVDAAQFQTVGAVALVRTVATSTGTVGTAVDNTNGLIVSPATGLVTSITLTFSNVVNAGINNGSLADGRWQLAIPPAGFTSTADDPTLRRLFGDSNNDGTVDGTDFGDFGNSFGLTLCPALTRSTPTPMAPWTAPTSRSSAPALGLTL